MLGNNLTQTQFPSPRLKSCMNPCIYTSENMDCKLNFFLYRKPEERVLGRVYTQSKGRSILKNECCYDISLFQSLQALLNCDVVIEQVRLKSTSKKYFYRCIILRYLHVHL